MAIMSMTGFARVDGAFSATRWHWEVRSVNGRQLEVRVKTPPGFDGLEVKIREMVQARLSRGSVHVALNVQRDQEVTEIRLNERALAQVLAAAERVRTLTGSEPVRADTVLGIRGVLEIVEPTETADEADARAAAMLASLGEALTALVNARGAEGERLGAILKDQIDQITYQVAEIERSPARTPEAVAARLKEVIARVVDAGSSLDAGRVHHEAVFLATRADIEEELKRLASHVRAARDYLGGSEPVGRKLDFLAQEFYREANTLCSKANDIEIVRRGLELKSIIDKLREQVQNIE